MIKHVIFTNQSTAENNAAIENWAVISISDYEDVDIEYGWHSVHRSKFIDVNLRSKLQENEVLMTDAQALEIVEFVHKVAPEIDGILVHCRAGVSRSAAVAKYIARTFDLPFNHQYNMFNDFVYDQLIKATATMNRRPKP